MKILVTGGSGYVGRNLIKELLESNYQVYSYSRKNPNIENCISILGDITNQEDLKNITQKFDVVFHTASKVGMWGRPKDFYDTNVIGTKNIVEFCKHSSVPILIYTSSPSVVFSHRNLEGVDESIPYPKKFLNEYSKTKAEAEHFILSQNSETLKTAAIRPHLIYGKDDSSLFPKIIQAAQSNRLKIIGDGKNLVDVTNIDLVVSAHIKLMLALHNGLDGGKSYFIGDSTPVNPWVFINQILTEKQIPPVTKKIPLWLAYLVGYIFELVYKLLKIYDKDPPMTRFVALNLSKSHYFSHRLARQDFQL